MLKKELRSFLENQYRSLEIEDFLQKTHYDRGTGHFWKFEDIFSRIDLREHFFENYKDEWSMPIDTRDYLTKISKIEELIEYIISVEQLDKVDDIRFNYTYKLKEFVSEEFKCIMKSLGIEI